MTKWLLPPLLAGLVLAGSGFMSALEATTRASAGLAETSRDAPGETLRAARETADLPDIAVLTGRQDEAFKELADALELSLRRVMKLTESVADQEAALDELEASLQAFESPITCARRRLAALIEATDDSPENIAAITHELQALVTSQNRSIEHLRSINRKLAALELLALATGTEALPPPGPAPTAVPGETPPPRGC